eukprot:TRINITY_DN5019_c2_g1_i1.p1 TRINITY_DN5019_c2_g1~~TRINITY_DN5019_c2_g1_i1.p1  ORF type:complete len:639 (-),score=144.55 TRINITY_DN5019_c2_g1_i1:56-1921(-)
MTSAFPHTRPLLGGRVYWAKDYHQHAGGIPVTLWRGSCWNGLLASCVIQRPPVRSYSIVSRIKRQHYNHDQLGIMQPQPPLQQQQQQSHLQQPNQHLQQQQQAQQQAQQQQRSSVTDHDERSLYQKLSEPHFLDQKQTQAQTQRTAGSTPPLSSPLPQPDQQPQQEGQSPAEAVQKRKRAPILSQMPSADLYLPPLLSFDASPPNAKFAQVAILGAPNAGKSTLVNALVGSHVSAVCRKAMTTRDKVLGIATQNETQVVFSDTPGVVPLRYSKQYGANISATGWDVVQEGDIVMVVVDIAKKMDEMNYSIIERLQRERESIGEKKIILVLNKSDLVSKAESMHKLKKYTDSGLFDEAFIVSAVKGTNVANLKEYLNLQAQPGDWVYPGHLKSGMSMIDQVSEIIRQCVYEQLNSEKPHMVVQETVGWTHVTPKHIHVEQVLYVPRKSQMNLLIGKGAVVITRIAKDANQLLATMLPDRKITVCLRVKIAPNNSFTAAQSSNLHSTTTADTFTNMLLEGANYTSPALPVIPTSTPVTPTTTSTSSNTHHDSSSMLSDNNKPRRPAYERQNSTTNTAERTTTDNPRLTNITHTLRTSTNNSNSNNNNTNNNTNNNNNKAFPYH